MKMTLTTSYAAEILRSDEDANWSYAGARALVEYLEELEESTGEDIEFCPVSLHCDYSEHDGLRAWAIDYMGVLTFDEFLSRAGIDWDGDETDDEIDDLIRDFVCDHGTLIEFDGGIIVSSF